MLRHHGVDDFAFTGGVAVGVWSAPRQTRDVDVCGTLPAAEVDRLLAIRDGVRGGAGALPDMVRFRIAGWDIDLFVSKSDYDRECLRRAIEVEVDGTEVRVVTVEDLLIHKMIKLRSDRRRILQDLADVRAVVDVQRGRLDWSYVEKWVPVDELALLRAISTSSDEDLLQRLLGR
ncbi:MAG: nucleotidyltransferase [Labilithrix sp.]|nr:nucleotidyltransferase [Labilithrix sp.]